MIQVKELEKVKMLNGTFAVCPECKRPMAHNAMTGDWRCFRCGKSFKEAMQ